MINSQIISYATFLLICLVLNLKYSMMFGQSPACTLFLNADCIVYVNAEMSWDDAELNCIQLGGHIVSIHSAAENTALNNSRNNTRPWIGFNDKTSEGTFVWSDGSTADYTNWNIGEPNDEHLNEDCGEFFIYVNISIITEKWNDIPCNLSRTSFCRISGNRSIALLNSTNAFCEGDTVVIDCTVSYPELNFTSNQAGLSINGSTMCYTAADISNGAVPRISYTNISSNNTAPARYTISPYLIQDSISTYRCCANTTSVTDYTPAITPLLAAPPTAANISLSTTYVSNTSCTGTITVTWPAVTSDREITSYEVLLNGNNIITIAPTSGLIIYTTNTISLLGSTGTYTVRAISCVGSSALSNEVVSTPPNPPSAANISISTTYVPSTSCTGTITLTWPAVTSDREVTSYEMLLNGISISTTTPTAMNNYTTAVLNLLEHFATYSFVATSCAGSNTSAVMYTPLVLSPPSAAIIAISVSYSSSTSCTGTITLTWPAVTSVKEVISYEVLFNGTNTNTTTPTACINTYTTSMMSLIDFTGTYTVRAISCVGSSALSNEGVITPNLPPPSAVCLTISTTYVPSASCTGTITLTWPAVTSVREVTSYEVLLNGTTTISTTTPTIGQNNYITGVLNLLQHYATYTVVATSCAGSSSSSSIMYTPPIFSSPSAANLTILTNYVSSTSCTGTITLTWPAVTSNREVTSYEVLLNGTIIFNNTTPTAGANTYTTSMMSLAGFTGTYTVRAISCVGSSVSNGVFVTPPDTTVCTIISPFLPSTWTLNDNAPFIVTLVLLFLSIIVNTICIITIIYLFRRLKTLSLINAESIYQNTTAVVLQPYATWNKQGSYMETDMNAINPTSTDRDDLVISSNLEPYATSNTLGYYYSRTDAVLSNASATTDIAHNPFTAIATTNATSTALITTADITSSAATAPTPTADTTSTYNKSSYIISDVEDSYAD